MLGIWRCWLTVLSSGDVRKLEFGEEVIVAPIPELVDGDVFGEASSRSSLARFGELGEPLSEPLASDCTPDSSAEKTNHLDQPFFNCDFGEHHSYQR